MALDYDALIDWPFEPIEETYGATQTILYGLGIGLGDDPTNPNHLRFVYEDGLQALPTMAVVLGYPGFYLSDPRIGLDWKQLVHGEQGLVIHRPLPPSGHLISTNKIDAVVDKGAGRGALVYATREQRTEDGELVATLTSTAFCRGDGGFGGPNSPPRVPHPMPDRDPDAAVTRRTLPQSALIYRLSGDRNPLHADPAISEAAGFIRPILHGLCSYGVAGYALLGALCEHDPRRLKRLDARFSAPVYPGESITTLIWLEGPGRAAFRCVVGARGSTTVIDNGYVEFEHD